MAKSVAEVIATQDAEAAFLMAMENTGNQPVPDLKQEERDALSLLAISWAKELSDKDFVVEALNKLTSDDGRRTYLWHLIEEGCSDLIANFGDDRIAAHRPVMLEIFLERCDDPGYFDEMLDGNAGKLTDDQKLKLLEKKRSLG